MALSPGTCLGPYEILSIIGAGGMGEVYRARDRKLDRDVAIKVLPPAVAGDPERIARFEREAQLLAALNHPNIAHIYGLEESDGIRALVMELVDGPTLADRIATGRIPIHEALPIARQIIEALQAAHERGIVHRDLKPANIKLGPNGTVKVLDFGLAKVLEASSASSANVTQSPTITSLAMMTGVGVILGTAAYMSPEQAKGRPLDKRTDIWAYGCVLFEMVSGQSTFTGQSVTEILAKVIEREPDWTALPDSTPASIRRLLRRCLEKDARRRLADIADARLELDEATATSRGDSADAATSGIAHRGRLSWSVALATFALTVVAIAGWVRASWLQQPPHAPATYVAATLSVATPNLVTLVDRFAVAPDGSAIVFVGPERSGLFLRRPADLDPTPIPGVPRDAFLPVFSPDGKWLAFVTDRGLMKIPAGGGTPVHVAEGGSDTFISLTWGSDDRLRYPALSRDKILSVSSSGGPGESVPFGPQIQVRRAELLPHGRLLVSITSGSEDQIAVREADGTVRVITPGRDGRLSPSGHLLYSRAEGAIWSLVAAPFDADSARVTGDGALMARDIPVQYATPAAVTIGGDLVYLRGAPRSDRRIVIVSAEGAERDVAVDAGPWVGLAVSPDGQQIAVNRWDGARRTIWTLAPATGALTQVTYDGDTFRPVWMPGGRRLAFTHFPTHANLATTTMWSTLVNGQGKIEPIFEHSNAYPEAASADGRVLYYAVISEQTGEDIYAVTLNEPTPVRTALITTRAAEGAPVPSPDNRWLAYATDASGRSETRVVDLGDLTTSVQVSTTGGIPIRWSSEGNRLFYRDGDTISVVQVGHTGPVLTSRRRAFSLPRDVRGGVDVMPDGERAIFIRGGLMYSDLVVAQGALRPRR
jgi:Tol biopolymer transport system component